VVENSFRPGQGAIRLAVVRYLRVVNTEAAENGRAAAEPIVGEAHPGRKSLVESVKVWRS
jgi:hypothetical protein